MELMEYGKAFVVGGLLCVVGQILIDRTKLTDRKSTRLNSSHRL